MRIHACREGGSHSTWMAGDKRAHSFCWGPSKWGFMRFTQHATRERLCDQGHGGVRHKHGAYSVTHVTTAAQSRAQTSGRAGWAQLLDVRQASPQPPQRLSTDAEQEGGALLAECTTVANGFQLLLLVPLCNFWYPEQRLVRIADNGL
jgi:hypothetical protein